MADSLERHPFPRVTVPIKFGRSRSNDTSVYRSAGKNGPLACLPFKVTQAVIVTDPDRSAIL